MIALAKIVNTTDAPIRYRPASLVTNILVAET